MRPSELTPGLTRFFSGIDPQVRLSGWERLRWSMSYEQVQSNYPQTKPSGGNLVMASDDPQARHFQLTFSFDASRSLQSVSLTFGGSSETADFAEMSQAITRRLGAPVESTTTSNTWRRDDTTVTLSNTPGGGIVLSQIT